MNRVRTVSSLVGLVLTLADLCAQQYPFLPVAGSPKIAKILFEDSIGRLWVGGPEPAWFDGTRFFFLCDYGFPSAEAFDFSEDPTGAIWIGAATGVYRFSNGKVEEIGKGSAVTVIAATANLQPRQSAALAENKKRNVAWGASGLEALGSFRNFGTG